jgi:hypothetical protein
VSRLFFALLGRIIVDGKSYEKLGFALPRLRSFAEQPVRSILDAFLKI